ncbi:hypothetical protein NQZ68_018105 [Dissostichus eleginoides]|nr:hypothetical protein NQZ68_018049 [Dissostichus eleginoides]KAI9524422.1 hypothetical protein NQZ68_018105 [Dissostichus eleginoides]
MSANSSSSFDHPHQSPEFLFFNCHEVKIGNIILGVFTVCSTLIIVPLSVTVLFLGHQQWRRHRSVKQKHSDIITYNMAVMEVFLVFGSVFYCLSVLLNSEAMRLVSTHVHYITSCGQMSLHILICVERYLAVVHPVKYRSLRQSRGDTIRNVSVGSVWLIACAEMSLNGFKASRTGGWRHSEGGSIKKARVLHHHGHFGGVIVEAWGEFVVNDVLHFIAEEPERPVRGNGGEFMVGFAL